MDKLPELLLLAAIWIELHRIASALYTNKKDRP